MRNDIIKKHILNKDIISIMKGLGFALIITFILLFVFSLLLTYTNLQENTMIPVLIGITIISILIGGCISTLKFNKNGIIRGGCVGLIYVLSIYFLSSVMGIGFSLNLVSIVMILSSIVAGMVGGIIGVNI